MWREMSEIAWLVVVISLALLVAYYLYPRNIIAAIIFFFVILFLGAFGGYQIFERGKPTIIVESKE